MPRQCVTQTQVEYEAKMNVQQEQVRRRQAAALGFERVPKAAAEVT